MSLLRSRKGNVLPIVAAGLVPMAAMVGGAVDMSRAYMVKARLQQACDAGVLAGRRAMAQGNYTAANQATARDFFDVNFNDGFQGTEDLTFASTNPTGTSRVEGTATVNVPTAVMGMFGKDVIPVETECEAELNVSNSDITFVLDTTGSMSGFISNGSGGFQRRIEALQGAVISFYDVLATAANGSNARVRYGFVPYSTGTNVGELLYDTNPQYLVGANNNESWNYESRRPIWEVTTTSTDVEFQFETENRRRRNQCESYGDERSVSLGNVTIDYERWTWGGDREPWSGGGRKTCVRRLTITTTLTSTTQTPNYVAGANFHHWEYLERNYIVDDFIRSIKSANPAVVLPTNTGTTYDRWEGCVEERSTVAAGDFNYVSGTGIVPTTGPDQDYDLDLDLIPTNTATKWKPYWRSVYYRRDGGRSTNCPQKAQLLQTMTRNELTSYVNSLSTGGNTYHDIGLIWGGRLSSPSGVFSANVTAPPNNSGTVQRHVIFMTDGELATSSFIFGAYGNEPLDERISGGSNNPSTQERHRRRFLAVCDAIKGKGIRLWAIAFGTSLTTDLQNCASSGSAFSAQDSGQLEQNFQNIAAQIAELRLTR